MRRHWPRPILAFALAALVSLAWVAASPSAQPPRWAAPAQPSASQRGLPRPERPALDATSALSARLLAASSPTGAGTWTSLSDLPWLRATSGLLALADQGEPRRDQAFIRRTPVVIQGQTYSKALGTLPFSEIEYVLPPDTTAFRSVLGLNDLPEIGVGSVTFHVFGDDVELYASGVLRRGDPPIHASVALAGVQRLRLVVTDAGDGSVGDYAIWADAAIERAPGTGNRVLADAIAANRGARLASVDAEAGRLQELATAELLAANSVLDSLGAAVVPSPSGADEKGTASAAIDLASRQAEPGARPGLVIPGLRAAWDDARGLLLLDNGALLLTLGIGGQEHGYLSAIDRRSGRLLFYDTTPALQLSSGRTVLLHGGTVADGSQPYRLVPSDDPVLGRGVEAAARFRLTDQAGHAVVRLTLFADRPYFTYQLVAEGLSGQMQVQRYSYFAPGDAGGFVVGNDGAYLADRSRLWDGTIVDDGFTRQATLEATKPLVLWNGPDHALLATLLDCLDAPATVGFRRDAGRAVAALEIRHDDVLGERPAASPRLLVEALPSGDLRRAPANYQRIMDALYPPVKAPDWLRHQMGSWYAFGPGVDDARIRQQVDYIAENLADLGPWHVVIDAGWHVPYGQADAEFRNVDYDKFPDGIRALVDYAHSRGVRVVLYLPTGYIHDGRGDGEWLALPELINAHPEWLTPLYTHGDVGRYLLDYRRPDVQAHVARTLEEALIAFDADGISIDGLADAEGQLIPLPLRQTWQGASPIQRSQVTYEVFAREIFKRKPDAYVETGWVTPTCARPYATTFRYADEQNVFTSPYPFGGFATHLDYAIYQRLMLGQRANMGANFGDPNRADALTWLRGALALGVQATLSFDLTTMAPETLARYRAHLAHYRPFEGETRFDVHSPPTSFATRRGPFTYLGVMNREAEPRTHTVSLAELGLDGQATYTAYDPEQDRTSHVAGTLSASLPARSFRLFVLRQEPGVLWTPSAFEERQEAGGVKVQVQGPGSVPGVLWLASPPPAAVLLDGAPLESLDLGAAEGYRYHTDSRVLEVRYAHQGSREIAVRWGAGDGAGP